MPDRAPVHDHGGAHALRRARLRQFGAQVGAPHPRAAEDAPARCDRPLDVMPSAVWPVRWQGERGACVAMAAAACAEHAVFLATGALPALSPQFIDFQTRGQQRDEGIFSSRVWLAEAAKVLAEQGVCEEADCPYDPAMTARRPNGVPPTDAARRIARRRCFTVRNWDVRQGDRHAAGWALAGLAAGQAVAMAIPVQAEPLDADGLDNWNVPLSWSHGRIADPLTPWNPAPRDGPLAEGHAVCLTGYTPHAAAPGGGWFIVRNSWGLGWASEVPSAQPFAIAQLPGRGYGAISARYVNSFCSELMTLKLEPSIPD